MSSGATLELGKGADVDGLKRKKRRKERSEVLVLCFVVGGELTRSTPIGHFRLVRLGTVLGPSDVSRIFFFLKKTATCHPKSRKYNIEQSGDKMDFIIGGPVRPPKYERSHHGEPLC